MFFYLLLAFTLIPVIEIALLIRIGRVLQLGPTILLVVLTGVLGAWLARREWERTWERMLQRLAKGDIPTDDVMDGMLIFAAGVVLVTPGVITDACGLLLLVPWVRRKVRGRLRSWFAERTVVMRSDADVDALRSAYGDNVVDAEFREIADDHVGRFGDRKGE